MEFFFSDTTSQQYFTWFIMSDASTPEGNASDDQESPDSVPSHADSKIQNLVNIRTRLSTGRHTPGLTNNQRSTVNK